MCVYLDHVITLTARSESGLINEIYGWPPLHQWWDTSWWTGQGGEKSPGKVDLRTSILLAYLTSLDLPSFANAISEIVARNIFPSELNGVPQDGMHLPTL